MESKFTTLINKDGQYIRVDGKDIIVTDIPVLFDAATTINDLRHKAEYVHIDFNHIDLIGISIVQIHK
jgi:hypothetical protein